MFSIKHRKIPIRTICLYLLLIVLSWGLISCGDRIETSDLSVDQQLSNNTEKKLAEAAPPQIIQQLRQSLEIYQPQVKIVTPEANQVLQDTTVKVQIEIRDLPIYKDAKINLGPNLQLILDNQSAQTIYDTNEPITLENLSPGSHTIRVFATLPWYESFKNDGAYAQTTFHVLTKTSNNIPDPSLPLLTYNRPEGTYGAEPIMLDFYLTNAPLHLLAKKNSPEGSNDWRIKVTVNGESFLIDSWEPVYLKGFQPGKNWVQLEFIDEQGKTIDNIFNNTVRLITYEPNGEDNLAKIIRAELPLEEIKGIVDPNYQFNSTTTAAPTEEVEKVEEEQANSQEKTLTEPQEPTITEPLSPEETIRKQEEQEESEANLSEQTIKEEQELQATETPETPSLEETKTREKEEETTKTVSPEETKTREKEEETTKTVLPEETVILIPLIEEKETETPSLKETITIEIPESSSKDEEMPIVEVAPIIIETPTEKTTPTEEKSSETTKSTEGFFRRFRLPKITPLLAPPSTVSKTDIPSIEEQAETNVQEEINQIPEITSPNPIKIEIEANTDCVNKPESFIAPKTLVNFAYQGLLQKQGIPRDVDLIQAYNLQVISSKDIIEAAIADCVLDRRYNLTENQGYLSEISKEVELLTQPQ